VGRTGPRPLPRHRRLGATWSGRRRAAGGGRVGGGHAAGGDLEPHLHLDAAADRGWASAGSGGQGEWRTDPSQPAIELRSAVLVAEATISRCLAEDGYLSARQLSVDLRQAAAWLAAGAQFGVKPRRRA
jgi:hypothetical protein